MSSNQTGESSQLAEDFQIRQTNTTTDGSQPTSSRIAVKQSVWSIRGIAGLFLLTGLIFILTPLWAVSWSRNAFPGFVVEQTLVVSDYNGQGWSGRDAGLDHPQRIVSVGEQMISRMAEFKAALSGLSIGQVISITVLSPNGNTQTFSPIKLLAFPNFDLLRFFLIPYAIGLAYLLIGAWVYRARGEASSSQAFAFFCLCAATSNGLLFDLITTHNAPAIWTLAMAFQGGALIRLALLFPKEKHPLNTKRWVLSLSYLVSLALAGWGLAVLSDIQNPWDYIIAWRAIYVYTAFGLVFFLGMMIYRLRTVVSPIARQQIRIILWGSLVAFIPIGIWLIAPVFGSLIPWNPLIFLPGLLFFPLSVGIAIVRYRMWDIDLLINRTLVYGVLTLLLSLIYIVIIVILQEGFINLTGQKSPLAVAVSTLAIAFIFNPLRKHTQLWIDRRFFRRKYDSVQAVEAFSATLRHEINPDRLTQKLSSLVKETMQPTHMAFYTCINQGAKTALPFSDSDPLCPFLVNSHEVVELDNLTLESPGIKTLREQGIAMVAPLVSQGEMVGLISLGPSASERSYTLEDRQLLSMLASRAAPALRIAQLANEHQLKAQEKQRIDEELRVARYIQQTLLPKQLPDLPGWHLKGHYQPAQAVGGDFFDFFDLQDGKLGVVIGDATGKGIPAALVMASARGFMRACAMRSRSPGEVLKEANKLLLPGMPASMFVTCLYAIIDINSGVITFSNAGHNLPCRFKHGEVQELKASGMPLGLMPDMLYEEGQMTIDPGDCVLFYSDGLVEAHNPRREMFGTPRLREFLCNLPADKDQMEVLLQEWQMFIETNQAQEDDMTLLVIRRIPA
jgi:serine phosphatase RsbU (regulator of sigma subunit)